ncbi:MAG: hypothetical protein PWQ52_965, partial [Methanolobus sp.]|nr:hypothetical protein [Methanolobus sp.]
MKSGRSLPSPVEYARMTGSSGRTQGESTLTTPARKEAIGPNVRVSRDIILFQGLVPLRSVRAWPRVCVSTAFLVSPVNLASSLFVVAWPSSLM